MTGAEPRSDEFVILLVCTGNVCRSALAERLAVAYLQQAPEASARVFRVQSAGTSASVGSGIDPDSELVLRGFGGEPGSFRARRFAAEQAHQADLVLTMTHAHRREVLHVAPRALAKTFTLREAADLMESVAEARVPGGDPVERARGLVRRMAAARAQRPSVGADDVPDPIGQAVEVHQDVGDAIATALLPILAHLVQASDRASG